MSLAVHVDTTTGVGATLDTDALAASDAAVVQQALDQNDQLDPSNGNFVANDSRALAIVIRRLQALGIIVLPTAAA